MMIPAACSSVGQGPTTWELQDSDSLLHEVTTDPTDQSKTVTTDRVEVFFTLDEKATVTFSIFNARGVRVNRPLRVDLKAGKRGVWWDGRNKNGKLCPPGTYTYQLSAVDSSDNKMTPPAGGKVKLRR